jgi:plastocyanin
MNSRYLIIGILIVAIILIGGFVYMGKTTPPAPETITVTPAPTAPSVGSVGTETSPPTSSDTPTGAAASPTSSQTSASAIEYTTDGFSPATLMVTAGTTVTWTNGTDGPMQVDSDPHPTHTSLPEINATQPTAAGKTYSATFTKTGTWGYHDHLHPANKGTVVVR